MKIMKKRILTVSLSALSKKRGSALGLHPGILTWEGERGTKSGRTIFSKAVGVVMQGNPRMARQPGKRNGKRGVKERGEDIMKSRKRVTIGGGKSM